VNEGKGVWLAFFGSSLLFLKTLTWPSSGFQIFPTPTASVSAWFGQIWRSLLVTLLPMVMGYRAGK
jgi:hypothetical protein